MNTMNPNSAQQTAIEHTEGPLLIIAGAGTGKTTVLTKRIEYLVNHRQAKPDQILAVTFTEKAAQEMVERLDKIMPLGYAEPWVHTFHGFCDRILKAEGLEIGLSPDYSILSGPEQWLLLKKNLINFGLKYYAPLGNPNKFVHALLKFFSRLQDEDVTTEEITNDQLPITKQIQNSKFKDGKQKSEEENKEIEVKYNEVFRAYQQYQQLKLKENALDFGDLIAWTTKLFRSRASVLARYRRQFQYLMVDEFQDTNFAQLQLIKLLAPPELNPGLTVVGDDDQSVYAFRGSSVHNILDFKTHYPQAKEVLLTTNYRSGQPVLNAAYASIQHNNPDRLEVKLKLDKRLVAARGSKLPTPQIIEVKTKEDEAEFVVEKILNLLSGEYSYKDFAVLARANNHLDPFVAALKRAGLPYQLIGNRGLFDQDEIRDLLFYLKVTVNPQDSLSLFQWLHTESLALSPADLLSLLSEAKMRSLSLWQLVTERASANSTYKRIVDFVAQAQDQDTQLLVTEILYRYVQDSGYVNEFLKDETIENQLKLKNLNLFFEKLKRFDADNPEASLASANAYFEDLIEAGENPAQAEIEDIDTINLLTIHASKGLEWPVVFLVNMVSDRFPSANRSDAIELPEALVKQELPSGDSHIQEERRLFYVAITRACDYFFAVYGKDYGGVRAKKPSPFLAELELPTTAWKPETKQLSWLAQGVGAAPPKPKKILDGHLELTSVSYSAIDTYQSCPLKYKYQYVLKVPTKPHHAMSFGSTIHATLQKFHQFEMQGKLLTLDQLLELYAKEFQHLGYESLEHREKRFENGKEVLSHYYRSFHNTFTGQRFALEKSFKLRVDDIPLLGRIDRVDLLNSKFKVQSSKWGGQRAEGQEEKETITDDKLPIADTPQLRTTNYELPTDYEVIDYKTGVARDQKTVDRDPQLTIYAAAGLALYGKLPAQLSLYFVEDGIKVSTTRTQAQVNAKMNEIAKVIAEIKTANFEAKPGFPMPCGYCPYNSICPMARKS